MAFEEKIHPESHKRISQRTATHDQSQIDYVLRILMTLKLIKRLIQSVQVLPKLAHISNPQSSTCKFQFHKCIFSQCLSNKYGYLFALTSLKSQLSHIFSVSAGFECSMIGDL